LKTGESLHRCGGPPPFDKGAKVIKELLIMKQNRFKSPVFWSGLATQVLSILVLTGVIGQEWSTAITGIVAAVLEAFTVFGLLNNPTSKYDF
jgi:uncharacterized membrane protein